MQRRAPRVDRSLAYKASFLHESFIDNDELLQSDSEGEDSTHLEKLLEEQLDIDDGIKEEEEEDHSHRFSSEESDEDDEEQPVDDSNTDSVVDVSYKSSIGGGGSNHHQNQQAQRVVQREASYKSQTSDDATNDTTSSNKTTPSACHISGYGFNSALRQASQSTIDSSKTSDTTITPNELAAHVAQSVHDHFQQNLPSFLKEDDYDSRDALGLFSTNEIIIGPLLGSGEFSHVYEIKAFRPNNKNLEQNNVNNSVIQQQLSQQEIDTRKYMKSRERYHDSKKCTYAVKHLRPTLLDKYSKVEYAQSASDIALEAEFLKTLSHPNIIKLRGVSYLGPGGFVQGPKGYFLIIDRLNETLDTRIKHWKKLKRKASKKKQGLMGRTVTTRRVAKRASADDISRQGSSFDDGLLISEDQVDVALQISSALMYLHSKNVMFRDLKPQNVGFDVRGDVKLFDFGLATIMPPNGDPYDDRFRMSGAGSPRYMAPEVLVDPPEDYNMKADVYTFGIVLWEMFALEVPYNNVRSRDTLVSFVVDEEGRPPIKVEWPEPIKDTLIQSFAHDMSERPTMQTFYNMLRFHLLNISTRESFKLETRYLERRRSSTSLRALKDTEAELLAGGKFKFPRKVKDAIFNRKSSSCSDEGGDTTSNGQAFAAGGVIKPRRRNRRTTTEYLNKFRLSVKHEE